MLLPIRMGGAFSVCLLLLVTIVAPLHAHPPTRQTYPVITAENAGQLGQIAQYGRGWVADLAYSPDGKWLALAGSLGVWLYDTNDFSLAPRLLPTPRNPLGVAFSTDGVYVAAAGRGAVEIWEVGSGALFMTVDHGDLSVYSVAFSPTQPRLASSGTDGTIYIWSLEGDAGPLLLASLPGHTGQVHQVEWTDDGQEVVSIGQDGALNVWRAGGLDFGRARGWQVHQVGLSFALHGTTLATGGLNAGDAAIFLWDLTSGEQSGTLAGHGDAVSGLAFSADGSRLLSGGSQDGTLRLWDVATATQIALIEVPFGGVFDVAYHPDGSAFVSRGNDQTVRLWDARQASATGTLGGFTDWVQKIEFSPNGQTLVAAGREGAIRLWETTGRGTVYESSLDLSRPEFREAATFDTMATFAFDGESNLLAAIGALDGSLRLWGRTSGVPFAALAGHSDWIYTGAFSPNQRWLATGGADLSVIVWDLSDFSQKARLEGHNDLVSLVLFSPDSTRVMSATGFYGTEDSLVRIWDIESGSLLFALQDSSLGVLGAAFSPDGNRLAVLGWDGKLRLWDLTSGELIATRDVTLESTSPPVFSPDGQFIAVAGRSGVAEVYRDLNAAPLELSGHSGPVNGIAFSPDSTLLVTADQSGAVRVWDYLSQQQVGELVGHNGPAFVMRFNTAGTLLASGGLDGTTRVWAVRP